MPDRARRREPPGAPGAAAAAHHRGVAMRIADIRTRQVDIPLPEPFYPAWAPGRVETRIRVVTCASIPTPASSGSPATSSTGRRSSVSRGSPRISSARTRCGSRSTRARYATCGRTSGRQCGSSRSRCGTSSGRLPASRSTGCSGTRATPFRRTRRPGRTGRPRSAPTTPAACGTRASRRSSSGSTTRRWPTTSPRSRPCGARSATAWPSWWTRTRPTCMTRRSRGRTGCTIAPSRRRGHWPSTGSRGSRSPWRATTTTACGACARPPRFRFPAGR